VRSFAETMGREKDPQPVATALYLAGHRVEWPLNLSPKGFCLAPNYTQWMQQQSGTIHEQQYRSCARSNRYFGWWKNIGGPRWPEQGGRCVLPRPPPQCDRLISLSRKAAQGI
jgi:hypothetical protein